MFVTKQSQRLFFKSSKPVLSSSSFFSLKSSSQTKALPQTTYSHTIAVNNRTKFTTSKVYNNFYLYHNNKYLLSCFDKTSSNSITINRILPQTIQLRYKHDNIQEKETTMMPKERDDSSFKKKNIGIIDAKETIFFICDVQEKFRMKISYMPSVIHVSDMLLKASVLMDIPVLVTEQYPKGLGKTVSELDLTPEHIHVVEKITFSMCNEELLGILKDKFPNVKSVVLAGVEAHVCVLQTALDLISQGYDVHILADGTSSIRQTDRNIAFQRMKQSGVWITTVESMMFQLLKHAKSPAFKGVSALCIAKRPDSGLSRL